MCAVGCNLLANKLPLALPLDASWLTSDA